jgi:hypothetical protein
MRAPPMNWTPAARNSPTASWWMAAGRPLARPAASSSIAPAHTDATQRRPLTDLPAVHDEAVAGRLAGKTVLIP